MPSTSETKRSKPAALSRWIDLLGQHYGSPRSTAPKRAFELLLWEYVAYLTDDADRAAAFAVLKSRVGTSPTALATASPAVLEAVCRQGGAIAVKVRAERMRDVAVRVRQSFDGDLESVLALPYLEARRILRTFPSIGPPGADKILLLSGAQAVLALDSNALRVLLRLGYGREHKSYGATYASAQAAASKDLEKSRPALQRASLLLRRHGQELCRRNDPRCPICPLVAVCAWARVK